MLGGALHSYTPNAPATALRLQGVLAEVRQQVVRRTSSGRQSPAGARASDRLTHDLKITHAAAASGTQAKRLSV